eukprot:COSAG06_NODE_26906_length_605_cov_0.741107_1_plen_53_part_01
MFDLLAFTRQFNDGTKRSSPQSYLLDASQGHQSIPSREAVLAGELELKRITTC